MNEDFEKLLLSQDWWIINRDVLSVVCLIEGFGSIEMPEVQLKKLEDKYGLIAQRLVGG